MSLEVEPVYFISTRSSTDVFTREEESGSGLKLVFTTDTTGTYEIRDEDAYGRSSHHLFAQISPGYLIKFSLLDRFIGNDHHFISVTLNTLNRSIDDGNLVKYTGNFTLESTNFAGLIYKRVYFTKTQLIPFFGGTVGVSGNVGDLDDVNTSGAVDRDVLIYNSTTADWEPSRVDYTELTNVPATFPPASHTHTKADITDFAHNHPISEVTGLQTALDQRVTKGGDTDGAPLVVGTNDSYNLNIITNNTQKFTVNTSGQLVADTPNYETLVTSDQVLANKRYVDDQVGGTDTLQELNDTDIPVPPNPDQVLTYDDPSAKWVAKFVDAPKVTYDNTASGLTATDVKGAIDELDTAVEGKQANLPTGVCGDTLVYQTGPGWTNGYPVVPRLDFATEFTDQICIGEMVVDNSEDKLVHAGEAGVYRFVPLSIAPITASSNYPNFNTLYTPYARWLADDFTAAGASSTWPSMTGLPASNGSIAFSSGNVEKLNLGGKPFYASRPVDWNDNAHDLAIHLPTGKITGQSWTAGFVIAKWKSRPNGAGSFGRIIINQPSSSSDIAHPWNIAFMMENNNTDVLRSWYDGTAYNYSPGWQARMENEPATCVFFRYDQTINEYTVWINGVTNNNPYLTVTRDMSAVQLGYFVFGNDRNEGSCSHVWVGEAIMWDRALSQTDIEDVSETLMIEYGRRAAPPANTLQYYRNTDPTPSNDISENHQVGSQWYNTTTDKVFICLDSTSGAAVWREVSRFSTKVEPSGDVVGTTDAQTLTNKTINGTNNTISNLAIANTTGLQTALDSKVEQGFNVGGGTGNLFRDKTGVNLNFKSISGTANLVVANNADTIGLSLNNVSLVGHSHDASAVTTGILSVDRGGTGAGTHTVNNFLQGNGTSAVTATKIVPTGDVVGTSDVQTLTNKTIVSANNTLTIPLNDLSDVNTAGHINRSVLESNGTSWVARYRALAQQPANCVLFTTQGTGSTPVAGEIMFLDADNVNQLTTPASVTKIRISKTDVHGMTSPFNQTSMFLQNDGYSLVGTARDGASSLRHYAFQVSGSVTDGGSYFEIPVLSVTSFGSLFASGHLATFSQNMLDVLQDFRAGVTSPAEGHLLRYDAVDRRFRNFLPSLAFAFWDSNATSSGGLFNQVNWVQGTFNGTQLLRNFTIGTNNGFTYTASRNINIEIRYVVVATTTGNDRTLRFNWYRNPSALTNPAIGGLIGGSGSTMIARQSSDDTESCSGQAFVLSIAQNDVFRMYVTNVENADSATILDCRVAIREIL